MVVEESHICGIVESNNFSWSFLQLLQNHVQAEKQRSREADSRHWFRRSEDSPAENRKPNLQQTMAHGVWKTVKRRGTTYSLLHKVSEISY